ncbi:mannitol dehydrogenase family protein [Nocardia transvalensis]|uniref:mannitol dehydrogenase family protein n=1 Tax=Nocardia transvalensis TaxID=37333 RepID=UPI001893695C|nr:mannitol dehydrogenase family protein [Nocardia transvalensis]MBF6327020.1 mannitol dehydrogenase family protein [Nocardia transvalensis]
MLVARNTVLAEPASTENSDPDLVPRLSAGVLPTLPSTVTRPRFAPRSLGTGIVHLGCGSFHRAHQALVTQHAIEATGDRRWGIAAVAMSRPDVVEALRAQDNLYTTLLHDGSQVSAEVVGTIREAVHAPSDHIGVARRIADPRVRIVTLTVTAGGYCVSPATGRLDAGSEPVQHDLQCRHDPHTAIGMLVEGLAAVRRGGGDPPVVISCDNMTANGRQLRRAVLDFAALRDDRLADWIERNVQFPCSVVDRIVQPATPADAAVTRNWLGGVEDHAPVSAEPFLTWTIEDFEGERPAWELAGAQFVTDVTDYELAKLRLLNGTHMLLAYLGALDGHATIADASSDPVLGALAQQFMLCEQGPTVSLPDAELRRTVDDLMHRFRNPAIRHDMSRVGRNGSDKMIPRVIDAMSDNIAAGRATPGAELLIAAWIRWFDAVGADDAVMELIDPRADSLAELARIADPHRKAREFLQRTDIFGELPEPERVQREVGDALADLTRDGVAPAVRRRLLPEFERSNR